MPFYFQVPVFWPFGARNGRTHASSIPVIPSLIGTTAATNSMSSHRSRTSSTPGHPTTASNHIQSHRRTAPQPEMRELGSRNVTFAPTHVHTHHGHHHHGHQHHHLRSRSVPRPPTEAHLQAYAQQEREREEQARARQGQNTLSSAQAIRSQSQGPRSRSQSASINAHLIQGSRTHMSQGTRPYLFDGHGLDANSAESERDGRQNEQNPSSSLPSLTADSNSSRVGHSRTTDEAKLRTASAHPSRNASTGGVSIGDTLLPRLLRPRYSIHRTDSGSRRIRAHSVDGASPNSRDNDTRPSATVPEPEPFVPPVPEALEAPHGRGRARSSLIHVVNRILPHSAQGTGAVSSPAPIIPHHHHRHHPHHTHSLPPPPHRQQHHHHSHHHHHHQHHFPPTHIAAITSQVPQAPYIPPTLEVSQPQLTRRLRRHVSFVNPNRPQLLHMHPLFAASSLDSPAPIYYDVTRPPSRTSVRCKFAESSNGKSSPAPTTPRPRENGEAVPAHVLAESATDPPTSGKLVLKSDRFPWEVTVTAGCADPASSNSTRAVLTNDDVLHALYHTLRTPILHSEWNSLDSDRSMQRRVSRAYQRRVEMTQLRAARDRAQASLVAGRRVSGDDGGAGQGGDGQEGVRRVDWLMGRTRLVGIVVERSAGAGGSLDGVEGVGKLIFSRD